MLTNKFVARFLRARGVTRVFGTPGSDTVDLIDALAGEGVEYVLTHHENTAAYMAATYGELTGVPGVVIVTKGPGVTNLASGIAAAQLDRRPVIFISAIISPDILEKNPHQEVPLIAFGGLISKLSEEMTHDNAAELLPRAYRTAISPRPGAVYIPISPRESKSELAASDADAEKIIATPVEPEPASVPDIAAAADLVRKARRPVAVVGVGVVGTGTSAETIAALEALGIPACRVTAMFDRADLILTIGLDGWDIVRPYRASVPVVSLDCFDANDRTFQPVTVGFVGDLGGMLKVLARDGQGERDWGSAEARETYARICDYELGVSAEHKGRPGIAPQEVFTELRKLVPRDTIITADAGAHKSLASQAWQAYGPRSYFVSNGLSPMGFALGAAMGAKLAEPDRTVVTFVGDGGFLMYPGDLATWVRLGLPMIQIVMVDHSLTQVKSRQQQAGFGTQATSFQEIDYSAVATSLGVEAIRADTVESFRDAVTHALAANRPVTIETILDASEYARLPSQP